VVAVVVKVVVASTGSLNCSWPAGCDRSRGRRDPGGVGVGFDAQAKGRSLTSHSAQSPFAAHPVKVVRPRSFLAAGAPP